MANRTPAIKAEGLSQCFRVMHERPDSIRELFTRFLRQNVEYSYFDAVKDVSFEMFPGESVAILGRNGSGKSTLLKMVAGVFKPTSGKVMVRGSVAPLLELGAGMHPELTGRENIVLNGLLMGYSKAEMLAKQSSIIDFAEIHEFIDTPVKQYSSGMYMRLAFAVATEVDPDVLIIDEILAVGDMKFQAKCMERLHAFRRHNKTILLVSHALGHVAASCDRAILLEAGRVVQDAAVQVAIADFKQRMGLADEEVEMLTDAAATH
ncbi:MAG TPA: ABC transporter ATP-binding protein [Bryobacteraceae bacterium]|jgi:ABC-type polysaccharide/polyol phosphate transport system ATPase subunit|nr:ABC transporter ATP-binding protein [Bryobacteraceae bacterium]